MNGESQLRAQTILYKNDVKSVELSVASIANAVRVSAERGGYVKHIELCFGDASDTPVFDDAVIKDFDEKYGKEITFGYRFFGFNSGTSKGQNILFNDCTAEYLMLYNPDVVVNPEFFIEMMKPYFEKNANVGMTESRQTPLEHPKQYNISDGSELWGAMACVIVPSAVYKEVGGLDEKNFFLYCDDVDFSWRLRLCGRKVIYCPRAVAFHGHRLNSKGMVKPSEAERYYSVEAAFLLAYKWSADSVVADLTAACINGNSYQKKALANFKARMEAGTLPERLDPKHKIAYFNEGGYSENRYDWMIEYYE